MHMKTRKRWDIFCTVVDNFGDVGVCWRLARQLAVERGHQVRLWLDDLTPLSLLVPDSKTDAWLQTINQVEVRLWSGNFPAIEAADVVIEAFACELPAGYLDAMVRRQTPPIWINLEYLSAEPWVEDTHRMASPHPRLALTKYFFFPGFTRNTGGLIREAEVGPNQRPAGFASMRKKLGLPPPSADELTVTLFAYENAALPGLFDAWARGDRPLSCLVPESKYRSGLMNLIKGHTGIGERFQRGQLTIHALPFLPQDDYDALLRMADLNFVRGEDSFVRAQWAMRPFVWQIYPQENGAHRIKLESFLVRFLAGMPPPAAQACRDFWLAWNEQADVAGIWPNFVAALPDLKTHATSWAETLLEAGDLATNLEDFAAKTLA